MYFYIVLGTDTCFAFHFFLSQSKKLTTLKKSFVTKQHIYTLQQLGFPDRLHLLSKSFKNPEDLKEAIYID